MASSKEAKLPLLIIGILFILTGVAIIGAVFERNDNRITPDEWATAFNYEIKDEVDDIIYVYDRRVDTCFAMIKDGNDIVGITVVDYNKIYGKKTVIVK